MQKSLTLLMAQTNPTLGAIDSNTDQIMRIIQDHQQSHDLIVFPELAICGYPPEDYLLRPAFHAQIELALEKIIAVTQDCHVLIGHPQRVQGLCFNRASLIYQQKIIDHYDKQQLPNYGVFDEKRYFSPGKSPSFIRSINGYRLALAICEDIWQGDGVEKLIDSGVDLLCILNASPFETDKPARRLAIIQNYAQRSLTVVYVNLVGGQDELVFDGQSMIVDTQGCLQVQGPAFKNANISATLNQGSVVGSLCPQRESLARTYQALVLGLSDYVNKNKFPGVVLGLSGGIDSALCLAIAVDALGAERVRAVLMPSRFTADMSNQDALTQAKNLKVKTYTLPIESAIATLSAGLEPALGTAPQGITAENLQSRIRGLYLMALSNHSGDMLISTSNKSEIAVGYGTLYGDMCGGFAVIKDLLKTQVYALARYRNELALVIPERVLMRAPSAELAENQCDQDSLPDYALLDAIIEGYMERNLSEKELIEQGLPKEAVALCVALIKKNEYKRHQAPPGSKVSPRAFGRDWRYPLTQQFKEDRI